MLGEDARGRRMARVTGTVLSVLFRREEDDWSVLSVQAGSRRVRVLGCTAAAAGQHIVAEGLWQRRANEQGWRHHIAEEVRATKIVATTPAGSRGIASFLASNVRGLGARLSQRLVQTFGDDLRRILDEEPQRLAEVKGVSKRLAASIGRAWQQHKEDAGTMGFLHEQGFSAAMCRRIYKTYGERCLEVLRTNPYQLCEDVRGIGFVKADEIGRRLAIARSSPFRLRAGLLHTLQQAETQGHCGLLVQDLLQQAQRNLEVGADVLRQALQEMLAQDESGIVLQRGIVWRQAMWRAQLFIAQRLQRLASRPAAHGRRLHDIEQAVLRAEKEAGLELAQAQRQAVLQGLRRSVSIITGGPGCGKTTALNVLLRAARLLKLSVELAAPTGKAAQRASEATGMPASTLHRLLRIGQDGAQQSVQADLLVVDEASMIDTMLMRDVVAALDMGASLIIVGDVDQLPSVGPGAVLSDLIDSGVVPCTRLEVVYRQGKGSLIIENAHLVNRGQMPSLQRPDGDFFFLHEGNDEQLRAAHEQAQASGEAGIFAQAVRDKVLDLVLQRLPRRFGLDPVADIMVLSPMNRGHCGVQALNEALQQALQAGAERDAVAGAYGIRLMMGDKVIQTRNNYDLGVFNGDTGRVLGVDRDKQVLRIDFEGRVVDYPLDDVDDLRLAYCITIHKSQGSQAPCVVIPLLTEHFTLLQRNLLYTAITRARKLCVLVGSRKAVAMAVRRMDAAKRYTALKELLQEFAQSNLAQTADA